MNAMKRALGAVFLAASSACMPPAEAPRNEMPDVDGDGIPDPADACPREREDGAGESPHDGCPEGPMVCRVGKVATCTARCGQGDAGSCVALGVSHLYGHGTRADVAAAKSGFERALAGGDGRGAVFLGLMHETGRGVPRDLSAAMSLYQKACDARAWSGCTNMGRMFLLGLGVPASDDAARVQFKLACERGDGTGCEQLASLHLSGRGVRVDVGAAFRLVDRGCKLGVMSACHARGTMELAGTAPDGVDEPAGRASLRIACDGGYRRSCGTLGALSAVK
jgi:TPR repeat protein